MTSKLDQIRQVRRLTGIIQAHMRLPLLRIGLQKGLFEALRSPLTASELAERLELAPDLVASWLRAAHAHRLVRCKEGRYQIGGFVRWLLDAEEAPAIRAILDQAALTYAPRLDEDPRADGDCRASGIRSSGGGASNRRRLSLDGAPSSRIPRPRPGCARGAAGSRHRLRLRHLSRGLSLPLPRRQRTGHRAGPLRRRGGAPDPARGGGLAQGRDPGRRLHDARPRRGKLRPGAAQQQSLLLLPGPTHGALRAGARMSRGSRRLRPPDPDRDGGSDHASTRRRTRAPRPSISSCALTAISTVSRIRTSCSRIFARPASRRWGQISIVPGGSLRYLWARAGFSRSSSRRVR